ncbi:hypothetical protein CAL14_19520 [Bordetella genomosp. 9]|nr:hypothetical protein CAL14_19520 [Bordetella genomosp. 9]
MTSDPLQAKSAVSERPAAPAASPSARALPKDGPAARRRVGRGSWMMASAAERMAAAALVSAALWTLTAWAMGWL